MKKLLLMVLVVSLGFTVACDGSAKNSEKANKAEETENVKEKQASKDEKVVQTLNKEEFKQKVLNYDVNKEWKFEGDLPCIVDFYADWCGPCKIASPILEEVAKEYEGKINVYKVDTQKDPELAGLFGVQGIPAFLYCPKEGQPTMSSGIGQTKEQTKEMFIKAIEDVLLKNN